ncbi:hypothetical protein GN956_G25421 [Arapaima gigas]
MEAKFEEVERNLAHCELKNGDIRKQLDSCLLLLAAGNIDPVLGQTIAEAEEQNEELQNNVMTVSRAVLEELGTFSKNMSAHRQQLQKVMQKNNQPVMQSGAAHCGKRAVFFGTRRNGEGHGVCGGTAAR